MNKSRFYLLIICGLIISNALLVWVILSHKQSQTTWQGPKQLIIEKLALNSEQVTSYEKLITEHQKSTNAGDRRLKKAKADLYETLNAELSEGEIDSLISNMVKIQEDIEHVHYDHFQKIKELCLPEQLNKFEELTKELSKLFKMNRSKK